VTKSIDIIWCNLVPWSFGGMKELILFGVIWCLGVLVAKRIDIIWCNLVPWSLGGKKY
jgi:hypothetical protein